MAFIVITAFTFYFFDSFGSFVITEMILLSDTADEGKVGVEMYFVMGSDKILVGEALISELKVTVKADEKTEVSFSFEGVGEIAEYSVATV